MTGKKIKIFILIMQGWEEMRDIERIAQVAHQK